MVIVVIVLVIAVSVTAYSAVVLAGQGQATTTSKTSSSWSSTSTTSSSGPDGIIAGYVTVGPSQPVCSANESSCNVDLTGYSLRLSSVCPASSASCEVQNFSASIAPSGHYSVLLAPGNYTITGLSPSCSWVGCSSAFPKAVAVEAGQQEVVDVTVDTGIR
jgi:hypothetical protein